MHDATVTRLFDELASSLHAWFLARTGDEHLADDLVQECFLRVHDRLGDVRDHARFAGWIRGIARNLVTDWRRARREPEAAELEELTASEEEPNLDAVVASWLTPAIDELEPADREVLRLTELEGVSQARAAEELGLSLPALKSRVLRGRARLRDRITACCELAFDRRGGIVGYRRRAGDPDDDADCRSGCC